MRVVLNPARARDRSAALAPAALFPTGDDLERARHLAKRYPAAGLREITLVPSPIALEGRPTWLALENMQVTGSFKVRGALLAMERRQDRARAEGRPLEVIAVSAGNHGIGVSLAAKILGAKATVMVPRDAPRTKVEKIAGYGATVLHAQSPGYDDAEQEAMELARSRGVAFLSPYDDVDVLVGNGASLAFEIVRALGELPGTVIAPVGGSGLVAGIAFALRHEAERRKASNEDPNDRSPVVFGAQSEASPAFARSLETGSAVTTLPPAKTLAEGLEGGIAADAFARSRAVVDGALVCTEDVIAKAMVFAYRELGLALEGSAAAALAPLIEARAVADAVGVGGVAGATRWVSADGPVVVVLTGRNVDPERLAQIVC